MVNKMQNENRLIETPADGIIRIPIMKGDTTVGERRIDLSFLPTADAVEVVHARWHDVYLMTPWVATGICSNCNLKSYINPDFPFAKYCPNCGAKMDKE